LRWAEEPPGDRASAAATPEGGHNRGEPAVAIKHIFWGFVACNEYSEAGRSSEIISLEIHPATLVFVCFCPGWILFWVIVSIIHPAKKRKRKRRRVR
jgi:hypothetical protein